MSAIDQSLRPLRDRLAMMVSRATVSAANDAPKLRELQIELLADEVQDNVEHVEPYGFTAHPHDGAEAIALSVGGLRSHAVVLSVSDRRYRLKMEKGECALYDDLGQKVHLTRDGIVIESAQGVTITTSGNLSMSAEGDVAIAGASIALNSDQVTVGNGAALDAARKSDSVGGGMITGGSAKVKIA